MICKVVEPSEPYRSGRKLLPRSARKIVFHGARKLTAALQAATGSAPADHPILLRIDRGPGDPQALADLRLEKLVDQRLFLMWQLGML